ncbi:MAG: pyridoxamine 5'-phosphate oxidase family protein, partial [Boseongicola sp. SB0670_bin_30]|nr:pyridoxamine 5'-phosphate oxidase family protein [Boseongicola sp. SB0670_bin_30]
MRGARTLPIGTKLNRSFRAFIERQPVFFVATAAPEGRVNVSPKGMGMLKILSDTHLRWLN